MDQPQRFEVLNGRKGTSTSLWPSRPAEARELPGVPVLAETMLKLELKLQQSAIDLSAFSAAVLSDVGATVQVLRLAGRECGVGSDRPLRVEECICDIGPRRCMEFIAGSSVERGVRQHADAAFWAHSREAAHYFRLFAAQASTRIAPEQAWLAGLLHALGALPSVLGWGRYGLTADPARASLAMAEEWRLPRFLIDFFSEVAMPGHSPEWSSFISVAHHPAKESWLECHLAGTRRYAFS